MQFEPIPGALTGPIAAAMDRLQIPGAALGVLFDGRAYAASFGVTNVDHPLPVTAETLFQIGSTSKTFTATVLMQLVERGLAELEAPVRTYLPDFRLASEEDAARLTLRHLVTHHGGFVGDYFGGPRDDRGDGALAAMVQSLKDAPQLTPAGYTFSYSNAGLYVAGRVIEAITGEPFERVVRKRIFEPLGMPLSTYFPEYAIAHRVAAGHIVTSDGPVVARPWHLQRAIAPGGGIISSVAEQLAYAAFHLGDGTPPSGERLLAASTMALMQQPQTPAGSMCEKIGITWMLSSIGGTRFVFHGGATNGHLSSFELAPDRGYALTLLTNADAGRGLRPFVSELVREHFLGIHADYSEGEPAPPTLLEECAGQYEQVLAHLTVEVADGALRIHQLPATPRGVEPLPAAPARAVWRDHDRFAIVSGERRGETVEFLRGSGGAIEWMRWDGRISRRTFQ